MARIVSLPNPGQPGEPKFFTSDDPALIEKFIRAETASGTRGIFDILNPLKPGATRHGKESIGELLYLFFDVDGKDIVESLAEIDARLATLPLQPTRLTNSGHGRHLVYQLKEGVPVDSRDYDVLCEAQARLIEYLCADPAVRPWGLLRRPGTINSKAEPHIAVVTLREGPAVDQTEFLALVELIEDASPLFARKEKEQVQVLTTAGGFECIGPVDVADSFARMSYGHKDHGVNVTHCHVIPSLLRKGVHPDSVVSQVVAATMTMAKHASLKWDEIEETKIVRRRVQSAIQNLLLKDYDYTTGVIPAWLNEEFHDKWIVALNTGRRPDISFNSSGFFVRSWEITEPKPVKESPTDPAARELPKDGKRFRLVKFDDLRPGPEPLYLVDELIPVGGLVDVWGKAKCFKSFWTLDVMLHVSMGWEYRDRYVQQGAVVYCAFEGAHGYKKRVEALRRHYCIEGHVPLYVMPGQANLIADHQAMITAFKEQLGDTKPVAVVLDTLNKSLVGSENKDIDMGAYVRAAEAIRDAFTCVVVIVHHCGYDDTRPRGHSSLPGAVDAQLAVTRDPNSDVVTVVVEMMRDGPEDTEVVSQVKTVDVGADQNGKPLTSLVLVPSAVLGTRPGDDEISRSLRVLIDATRRAIREQGTTIQLAIGELPVPAAKQKYVRDIFDKTYAEPELENDKRGAKIRQAFGRALKQAQTENRIGSFAELGEPMLYFKPSSVT